MSAEVSITHRLEAEIHLAVPRLGKEIEVQAFVFHFEGTPETASLLTEIHFAPVALTDLQGLYPVQPEQLAYQFVMKRSVLQPLQADYYASQNLEAFLQVGQGACFQLENYVFDKALG